MSGNGKRVSRRNVLKGTGAGLAAVGSTGLAAAAPDDEVEVNVGFSAESGRQAALSRANAVVRDFDSLDIVTLTLPKKAADALSSRADVRYVEENGEVKALAQTEPWGVERTDADVVHRNGETGAGADVAIIDTGIDSDHPDDEHTLGEGHAVVSCGSGGWTCYFSGNSNACNTSWDDDNDHGTHCAGIAAGNDDSSGIRGVAPGATLHAVKVLDCAGSGSYSDIAAGVEHVADQGWDVGSLSLGGSASSAMRDAVQYATDQGVFLVAAAGNDGSCTDCVSYPAAYPEVMAVSSTNQDDQLSSFSSQGPEIEIAAPGTNVESTVPSGYATFSGTSMACPHVAGGAAQLIANGASASGARSTLKSSAENIGLSSNESGSGLLDVAAALGLDSSDDT